ncbi:MAG TPA: FliM/FliN family flagellar motor C-terminal domain-containing protein [Candidatus Binatia bacterium]|nr:FliM/FliN family flagellar motor C-terminal domain-containing protein [Candidatus Binatia bacterium]
MSAASAVVATVQGSIAEKQACNEEARWQPVLGLNCSLSVDIPLPGIKVSDFVGLRPATVVNTGWAVARDVPLRVNGILIGWGELEGAGSHLALRVTELA